MPILPRVVIPSYAPEVGDPSLDSDIIHRPRPESFAPRPPALRWPALFIPIWSCSRSERRDLMLPQRPQTN